MKRLIVAFLGLGIAALVLAAPESTFSATAPTQYEDGSGIPATDVLTYKVHCSNTQGGPYLYVYDAPSLDVGTVIDVATCVQGQPGSYYFVATAYSNEHATESSFSNEQTRAWSAFELGKVPQAPTLFTIQ